MRRFRLLSLVLTLPVLVLALAACSGDTDASAPPASATAPATAAGSGSSALRVVATTTVLGDVVGEIVRCGGGTITTLMPVGADPHDFAASSDQVASMVGADLVVANGLGLEGGLGDALENATADGATVLEVADLVDPLPFAEIGHADEHADEHAGEEADEHAHGDLDPHFWFDMQRMATAATLVGERLTELTGDPAFTTCAMQTADGIRAAEAEVRATLESVPANQRVLVTDHNAFGYLAKAYGYEIVGTVIPSGTTMAEPSSADLAELAAVVRAENVPAIFTDANANTQLAQTVAEESGIDVQVLPLYSGGLGEPGGSAGTYLDMMRTNAQTIADGLDG